MSTDNITKPLQKTLKQWWIKFNPNNGKILKISSKPTATDDSVNEIIASTNPVCKKIALGQVKANNYAVVWDFVNDRWEIDKKSNVLVIKPVDNKLRPFVKVLPNEADIYVKVYKDHALIDVSINFDNIRRHKNLGEILEISTADRNLLDLYLTKKNDPDYLIAIIRVDSAELCKDKHITISLDNIVNSIDWSNVSLYTKPVFTTYGVEYINVKQPQLASANKNLLYNVPVTDSVGDINIIKKNNKLYIKSYLTDEQIYYFETKSKFQLHISDDEVDAYVCTLQLSAAELTSKSIEKIIDIPVNTWPTNPIITHSNKYITINYKDGDYTK